MPTILLIVVHYNSSDSLVALLCSLQALVDFPKQQVFVVDNLSHQQHLATICRAIAPYPNVTLLELPANYGYLGAAKFCWSRYQELGNTPPNWVIVCNHDVLIEDQNFFDRLLQEDSSAVGMLAPHIRTRAPGADQNPFLRQRPGWLRRGMWRLIYSSYQTAMIWHWLWLTKQKLNGWLHSLEIFGSDHEAGRECIYRLTGRSSSSAENFSSLAATLMAICSSTGKKLRWLNNAGLLPSP